ncbi:hypothetical protein PYW08_013763 [Mythimna loreyi]|uniref:Uncharacterized protein n=1 Tax=Mythimna loreyi TaxID=667449 RepID=A0ACC2R6V5_9NEOP|nr:hypothetical protein PYW08_013763 [Mythimna loreyi]
MKVVVVGFHQLDVFLGRPKERSTMSSQLPPPEKLILEGDTSSMGLKWEKWKRSLLIYLEASDISTDIKKRATLLVLGGSALQDIFYNLPGANVNIGNAVNVFDIAISKLDDYFLPKQNKTYERHIFRQIEQVEGESFEQFLLKLRDQAAKCKFDKPDDQIIDQITGNCLSSELRKKILTMGDEITLDKVISAAKTIEIVNHQLESYEKKDKTNTNEINAIKTTYKNKSKWETKNKEFSKCGRCGQAAHTSQGSACPALGKKCNGCGKLGHYQRCCRTKYNQIKRKSEQKQDSDKNYHKRQKQDTMVNSLEEEQVEYIFNLNDDATIKCEIGGVSLEMLIDSGCKLNLISDKTWDYLKRNKVHCYNQVREPNKIILAYGSKTPLHVSGSFEAIIKANSKEDRAKIYVTGGGSRNLLGKDTAIRLGVLRLGVSVNQIN